MSWVPGNAIPLNDTHVYEYTLSSNQLRVLLCPQPGTGVCAYMRAVHAGAKEEAACAPLGAAHFIEHMSFRIQNGKIWSLASKGDVINAETNMDSTRFYVVHLPEQTEQTIEIDAARFKETAVPADKVDVERHAVINELERGEQAGNKMFHTTGAVSILSHPYHGSPIGTRTCVNQTKAYHMQQFRQRYYVPNNTTLIFSGEFSAPKVLEWVKQHFGDMLPGNNCHAIHTQEPPQTGKRSVELEMDAPCPMLCMAFRQPKGNTRESLALRCISHLTWRNNQGRAKHLIENGVLHDVSTYSPRQLDPYLWFFHGTYGDTSPKIRNDIETKMLNALQTFSTQKVSQETLDNLKISMKDNWNRSMESVTDVMEELGRGVSMGNWKDFAAREATLDQITINDIQRVAQATFRRSNMTVTHVIPTKHTAEPLKINEMAIGALKTAPAANQIQSSVGTHPNWEVSSLNQNTQVLAVPKAAYVRATLSARFSPAESDLASIMTSVMGNGKNASGVSNTTQLMSMHTERSFTHDHEFIHLSMDMPSNHSTLGKASILMIEKEWLHPTFTSHDVQLEKQRHIAEIKSLKQDQSFQTKKEFMIRLFEQTQYHMPLDVRATHIQNITLHEIKTFHQKSIALNQNTYATITVPHAEMAETLINIFPKGNAPALTTFEWEAKPRVASTVKKILPGYGSFQIMVGQTVDLLSDTDDYIALHVAANILGGGMTARLMHTVRELRGLGTYGIYAYMQTVSPKTPAIFCISGTFGPAYIKEGMECTKTLLDEWQTHGITQRELSLAKERLIGSRIISNNTVDNLHLNAIKCIMSQHHPKEAFDKYKQRVQQLTVENVNAALIKYIDTSTMTSVIVGPEV